MVPRCTFRWRAVMAAEKFTVTLEYNVDADQEAEQQSLNVVREVFDYANKGLQSVTVKFPRRK